MTNDELYNSLLGAASESIQFSELVDLLNRVWLEKHSSIFPQEVLELHMARAAMVTTENFIKLSRKVKNTSLHKTVKREYADFMQELDTSTLSPLEKDYETLKFNLSAGLKIVDLPRKNFLQRLFS